MTSYDIFLLLLWLLFTLALRWTTPEAEMSVLEQLKCKINSLEDEERQLIRELADVRARISSTDARTAAMLKDTSAAQACDRQQCINEEGASMKLELRPRSNEELQFLSICRSMVLECLTGAIGFAGRRNAAVSRFFFELFGETNGNVELLSSLTDPWRRWSQLLVAQRNRAHQVFTQCLERASRSEVDGEELALPTGHQYSPSPEQDWGFDRVLDLARLRLSLPLSPAETVADHEFLRCARRIVRFCPLREGSWDGAGGRNSSFSKVHESGSPHHLAGALHRRLHSGPEMPILRGQDRTFV
ncbi:uncharacterized protein LOC144160555 [Haemaphysalis longicornis]